LSAVLRIKLVLESCVTSYAKSQAKAYSHF